MICYEIMQRSTATPIRTTTTQDFKIKSNKNHRSNHTPMAANDVYDKSYDYDSISCCISIYNHPAR